ETLRSDLMATNNEIYNVLTYDDLLNLANQGIIHLGDIQETAMQAGISAGGLTFFLLCYAPILLKKIKMKKTNEKDEELSA
ncbi:MAG: hypothetical protein IKK20_02785, partial [Clostridia bacterium]|nr:hypothetical protein [Clostridia bacterium]